MSKRIINEIKKNFESKSTEELLDIWHQNDRDTYSNSAFVTIEQILSERNITIPTQPSVPPQNLNKGESRVVSRDFETLKKHLEAKTNEELIDIWVKNDREKWGEYIRKKGRWSNQAFEEIRKILQSRGIQVPEQNIPSDIKQTIEIVEKLKILPYIPINKAIKIERRFAVYSFMLLLWFVFGLFVIFKSNQGSANFETIITRLRMASENDSDGRLEFTGRGLTYITKMNSEYAELLLPHIRTLEKLATYNNLCLIFAFFAWIAAFHIRRSFVKRKKKGPRFLLIIFVIWLFLDISGVILSLPIPSQMHHIFGDYFVYLYIYPCVRFLFLLDQMFFFGKTTSIFYQYTAIDNKSFKKNGLILEMLKEREKVM